MYSGLIVLVVYWKRTIVELFVLVVYWRRSVLGINRAGCLLEAKCSWIGRACC